MESCLRIILSPSTVGLQEMSVDRLTRVNEILRREIAEALFQIMSGSDFDLSAVMITRVTIARDLKDALVMVSIRDHHDERDNVLRFLRKHRGEIQRRISSNLVLKYTPRLSFKLDTSVEKGDRMLNLLSEMEREEEQDFEE